MAGELIEENKPSFINTDPPLEKIVDHFVVVTVAFCISNVQLLCTPYTPTADSLSAVIIALFIVRIHLLAIQYPVTAVGMAVIVALFIVTLHHPLLYIQ